MEEIVEATYEQLRLLIPHERYDLVARLHREGGVRKQESTDDGFYLLCSVPERLLPLMKPFILS